jgi:hypothetical protein
LVRTAAALRRWRAPTATPSVATANAFHTGGLDHDPIKLNRIKVWFFRWSMVFSENRHPSPDQVR